jgi:lysine-N-methylase
LPETTLIRPDYAANFHCISSSCEDTCCQGWSVPIDQATHEKYQNLPASPLRTLIDASILIAPDGAAKPATFAKIRMNAASNQCPMLSEDRLCGIQAEYGEALLSHTCATYPRIVHSTGGQEVTALALSCPEAARLVLLSPDLLNQAPCNPSQEATTEQHDGGNEAPENPTALLPHSELILASVLALVRNRTYPLWQRLFLLGVFCRRLDSIAKGELQRTVPAFLHDFEVTVGNGALITAMESLPLDRKAQLDVVLQLAGMLLHRSNIRPRFVECIQAFTTGIGNGPGATLESLTDQYALAYDLAYAPFFVRHPHILENYLINTILRCQFPFGKEGSKAGATPSLTREFALLTAQFALMKGLLIGVAGFHREAFSTEHVVHTIQAASKHFEHHPEFLNEAHALLVENQMDGARGLAILLRNTQPNASRPPWPTIPAPGPLTRTQA